MAYEIKPIDWFGIDKNNGDANIIGMYVIFSFINTGHAKWRLYNNHVVSNYEIHQTTSIEKARKECQEQYESLVKLALIKI